MSTNYAYKQMKNGSMGKRNRENVKLKDFPQWEEDEELLMKTGKKSYINQERCTEKSHVKDQKYRLKMINRKKSYKGQMRQSTASKS